MRSQARVLHLRVSSRSRWQQLASHAPSIPMWSLLDDQLVDEVDIPLQNVLAMIRCHLLINSLRVERARLLVVLTLCCKWSQGSHFYVLAFFLLLEQLLAR